MHNQQQGGGNIREPNLNILNVAIWLDLIILQHQMSSKQGADEGFELMAGVRAGRVWSRYWIREVHEHQV